MRISCALRGHLNVPNLLSCLGTSDAAGMNIPVAMGSKLDVAPLLESCVGWMPGSGGTPRTAYGAVDLSIGPIGYERVGV